MGELLDFLNISEKLKENLEYSSLADNASFGLEFYLKGKNDERTRKLIEDGIKLCKLLETGNEIYDKSKILIKDLESRSAFDSLLTYMLNADKRSPEWQNKKKNARKGLESQLKHVTQILDTILKGKKKIPPEKIRECQQFFNEIGTPYLRQAFSDVRKLETEENTL